jgi:hypothetical protein
MASASGSSGPPNKRLKQSLLSFALPTTKTNLKAQESAENVLRPDIQPDFEVHTVHVEVHRSNSDKDEPTSPQADDTGLVSFSTYRCTSSVFSTNSRCVL